MGRQSRNDSSADHKIGTTETTHEGEVDFLLWTSSKANRSEASKDPLEVGSARHEAGQSNRKRWVSGQDSVVSLCRLLAERFREEFTVCLIHQTPSPFQTPWPSFSSCSLAWASSPRDGNSSKTALTGLGMNCRNSSSSEKRSWNESGDSGRPRVRDHCIQGTGHVRSIGW